MIGPAYVLEREPSAGGDAGLRLQGRLFLRDVDRFRAQLESEAPPSASRLALDVSGLEDVDGAAAAVLLAVRAEWRELGGELEFVGAHAGVQNVLELYGCPGGVQCLQAPPQKEDLFDHIGRSTTDTLRAFRDVMAFVGQLVSSFVGVLRRPRSLNWAGVPRLMERAGADGAPIVLLINFLIGVIMALQSAELLSRFGAERFVADLVGLSMTRELAPLMTAIVVAGRSGAAFAAELGTMKVSEEIDALETLGLDPQRYLVFPRVLALVAVVPLLTLLSDVVGILGGLAIATTSMGLTPRLYLNALGESLGTADVVGGLVKSAFFALTITFISCQRGLSTRGGATGVGESTTASVVAILFALIVQDAIFTVLFDFLGVMNPAALIRVRGLSIGFDGVPLLQHLDFEVREREVFVILGGSGCGKSTLLRHLIGLQAPLAGSIEIDGEPPVSSSDRPPRFGVMFQGGALFSSMTLLENVALPIRTWTSFPRLEVEIVATARLRLVGLGGFENHLPAEISGGMRKRAAIARALALDPRLLFLDEPSAGLDPVSAVELDDLIATMRDDLGVTTVMVTHELESIFRIGDRCIMLDREARGIIAEGDPRHLREQSGDPRVHRFFNRLPEPSRSAEAPA